MLLQSELARIQSFFMLRFQREKKVAEAKKLCSSNFFSPCSAFVHKVEEKKLI